MLWQDMVARHPWGQPSRIRSEALSIMRLPSSRSKTTEMTHLVQRTWRGADAPIFVKEYPVWDGRMVCRGALNSRRMSCNIKEAAGDGVTVGSRQDSMYGSGMRVSVPGRASDCKARLIVAGLSEWWRGQPNLPRRQGCRTQCRFGQREHQRELFLKHPDAVLRTLNDQRLPCTTALPLGRTTS